MPAKRPSPLRDLFGDQAARFEGGAWPDEHLVAHGRFDRFPEAMRRGELSSIDRVCASYKGPIEVAGGGLQIPIQRGGMPEAFLSMGMTVQFSEVRGTVPLLGSWFSSLEADLGMNERTVSCDVWASSKGGGLAQHYDPYETIIMQIAGTKRYRIAKNRYVDYPTVKYSPGFPTFIDHTTQFLHGVPRTLEQDGDDPAVADLRPGSVLYFPRGYWHATEAMSAQDSLSVSIRLMCPTPIELLMRQLRMYCMQDPEYRRPLYGAWSKKNRRTSLQRVSTLLHRLADDLREFSPESILMGVDDIKAQFLYLHPGARFVRVPTTQIKIRERGPVIEVAIDGFRKTSVIRVTAPRKYRPFFEWIFKQKSALSLGQIRAAFPDISADDIQVLLMELVESRLLHFLSFDAPRTPLPAARFSKAASVSETTRIRARPRRARAARSARTRPG